MQNAVEIELRKFMPGEVIEGLGVPKKRRHNWGERHGLWPLKDGKHFRADVFDIAEMLAFSKIFPLMVGRGDEVLPLAKYAARGIGVFALMDQGQALVDWKLAPGWWASVLEERFPEDPRLGIEVSWEGVETLSPARWLVLADQGAETAMSAAELEDNLYRGPVSLLDLRTLGRGVAETFGDLMRLHPAGDAAP